MIFVDEARIHVKGGNGGQGCESFFRDKAKKYPEPNGGNGGQGGDAIFVADSHIQTLLDYRFKQHYQAEKGGNASSNFKQGKDGHHFILKVPLGTILRDYETGLLIRDLVNDQDSVVVARGGRGGRGNGSLKSVTSPQPGQEKTIHLELKLIAQVGLIGFPNAGKSTLISNISRVKSKIADYPFTTKSPILGVVGFGEINFVVADLPGIIEGAHEGKGLGDRFLRHAERTKILVHLVDMSGSEGRDPLEDYAKINHELASYSDPLSSKYKIVVANKMDLPGAEEHLKRFKKKFRKEKIISISAIKKEGLKPLLKKIHDILCDNPSNPSNV